MITVETRDEGAPRSSRSPNTAAQTLPCRAEVCATTHDAGSIHGVQGWDLGSWLVGRASLTRLSPRTVPGTSKLEPQYHADEAESLRDREGSSWMRST